MNNKLIGEAFGGIDDDLVSSAYDRRNVFRKKKGIITALLAACILVGALALALPGVLRGKAREQAGDLNEAGGLDGKININAEIEVTGSKYAVSNEEGYAFLESMSTGIRSTLKSLNVKADDMRIMKTGYSHVRTGSHGNSLAADWRDYLVYSGDKIIAVINVMKDRKGLHYFLSWGSPVYDDYARFLAEHRGEELVYIYAGDVDAVITPDNEIYAFTACMDEAIVEEEKDLYYSFFKKTENTYVPE